MKNAAIPFMLTALVTLLSCDPEPLLIEQTVGATDNNHSGMFILSEGLFNQNNSSLSWIDFSTGLPDSWTDGNNRSYDSFLKANGRRLGDTANDMLLYGSRLYIAVSESSTIEVVDAATCRSIKQLSMMTDGKAGQPRHLTAYEGFVYVCSFDGTVSRIDTLTLVSDAAVRVGRNPDGICCAAGKLYVSNSGGLDFNRPDSTVSVIDTKTFTEIARITVHPNPGFIYADNNSVYVISRGIFDYGTMDYDSRLHRIDTGTDQVTHTYNLPILNMSVADGKAWFYGYGKGGTIQVLDLATGIITDSDFITDGTVIERPYSITADRISGRLYVTDAADYVTPGSLLCFSPDGRLLYRIKGIGINPNSISLCDFKVRPASAQQEEQLKGHVSKVFEYRPAPGQFVNLLPEYVETDDANSMALKCLNALRGNSMITLGGLGGYVTVGFDEPIVNVEGMDFGIDGNFITGGAEPGIVWVSADVNLNGLPDDPWYEIAGSEHKAGRVISNYTVTYSRPSNPDGSPAWRGSDGRSGSILRNTFHKQPYYPQWYAEKEVSFTVTLLPDNMSYSDGIWTMASFGWGYADNLPNGTDGSRFDIDWAILPDGTPALLDHIDFIKVQTGVIGCNSITGELSTEVSKIFNLNPQDR